MAEKKCTQCGAVISQSNPGELCFPCQDKIRRELREKNSDNPNYDVDDMCSILGLSPEQVRRLGRSTRGNHGTILANAIKKRLGINAYVANPIFSRAWGV